jgi:arylsulfatase A-like enzyme
MFENSIKVPAIFSQPGRIPAGRAEETMVSAYDMMPTLLDYLGLPMPEIDSPGQSFAPCLTGDEMNGRDEIVIFDEYGPVRMIRTPDWKYVYRHAHGPHELYDLANDPDERENLAGDPGQAERIAYLGQRMDEWFARYVDSEIDGLRLPPADRGQIRLARDR